MIRKDKILDKAIDNTISLPIIREKLIGSLHDRRIVYDGYDQRMFASSK